MRKLIVHNGLLLVFALLIVLPASAARQERLLDTWQPVHFDINITFNDSLSALTAAQTDVTVLIRKNGVAVIDFDFGAMPVSKVLIDGAPVKFAQHDNKLDVFLAAPAREKQTFKVSVFYSGMPADGLIMKADLDGLPSAIGDNWPDRVHHWIPCFDHPSAKATVRFTVTAPARNEVVANGVLESKKDGPDATRTWTYREDKVLSPYNMVVGVGQFAVAQLKTKTFAPISYYVTHSDRKFAEQGFSTAGPSVNLFEQLVAPYPYGKLALIVGATRFGGMENANTIVFAPTLFKDFDTKKPRSARYNIPTGVEGVVAHEIAHQWFGASVTEATWADLWLSEGFATYFASVFVQRNDGEAAFRARMKNDAAEYFAFAKTRRIPLHDTETEDLFGLLNKNNYEKGAWILHMLRSSLGDKAFFAGVRLYYNTHKESTATSDDLRAALEKASGKDLKNFFARWVYQSGHPVYQATWTNTGKKTIELKLTQSQPGEAFTDPVTLEVITGKTKRRVVITPAGKTAALKIPGTKPTRINIDPDDLILDEPALQ